MQREWIVCGKTYREIRLLGHGKGGYSYLAECDGQQVVLKQIHHEPCDYYAFGNKIEAEKRDYERLRGAGIRIPRLLAVDTENERIVKEYISGETICALVRDGGSAEPYLAQARDMAARAEAAGFNLDYFPTNFVIRHGLLYYVDYECSEYSDMWNFENWGIMYWSRTPQLLEYLNQSEKEREFAVASLRQRPDLTERAADWFQAKWGVPREAYLACMRAYLTGETEYGWYLCLKDEEIAGGLGVIENDFHDRKDLAPNVCAVYTEEAFRGRGIAGRLLNRTVEDLRAQGISPVYLVTDHTGFYERYGWEFFCMAQGDGEEEQTRVYIHR